MANQIEKEWVTEAGFPASVVIVRGAHRCGYVGVHSKHPAWGVDYMTPIPEFRERAQSAKLGKRSPILAFTAGVNALAEGEVRPSLDVLIDCHGGLTYASGDPDGYPSAEVNPYWWFGFDCAHSGDGSMRKDYPSDGPVRSLEYCVAECESIAAQLSELYPPTKGLVL